MLRFDEQYLIRAEARMELEQLDLAKEDLDYIRNRAGLSNTTALSKEEVRDAIVKERRLELFTEWGHRWFDLKRWGLIDAVLSLEKGINWQSSDATLPIPLSEINLNPFLSQNPGY